MNHLLQEVGAVRRAGDVRVFLGCLSLEGVVGLIAGKSDYGTAFWQEPRTKAYALITNVLFICLSLFFFIAFMLPRLRGA